MCALLGRVVSNMGDPADRPYKKRNAVSTGRGAPRSAPAEPSRTLWCNGSVADLSFSICDGRIALARCSIGS